MTPNPERACPAVDTLFCVLPADTDTARHLLPHRQGQVFRQATLPDPSLTRNARNYAVSATTEVGPGIALNIAAAVMASGTQSRF